MAVGDLLYSFDPAKGETPQTIAKKRMLADAIVGNSSHAPRDIGEGLNAIGQALVYRKLMGGADKAEAAGNSGAAKVFQSLFGGSQFPAAPDASPSAADTSASASPSPGLGGSAGSAPDLSGNDIYAGFMDTVKSKITNPNALAAVAATGKSESAFDPARAGGSWSDPSESGGAGTSGGVMSWRGPRFDAMRNFAAANGGDRNNPSPQLQAQYFLQEDPGLIDRLNTAKSPAEAQQLMNNAWKFAGYDRPGGEAARRIALANSFAPQFSGAPGQAAPVQVASLDPSAGMATPASPILPNQAPVPPQKPASAQQAIVQAMTGGAPQAGPAPPQGGPVTPPMPSASGMALGQPGDTAPAGQRVLAAMMQQQPMAGGAPMPMQSPGGASMPPQGLVPGPQPTVPDAQQAAPQVAQAAAPQLPSPSTIQDRPVASVPDQSADLSKIPVEAGGTGGAIPPGAAQEGPTVQQLMQAAGDPFVMQKYGPVIEALLQQKMKQGDPSYALDLADKQVQLQLHQQQLGGNFRGDSMDAQAWNILQTRDPSSKEYQTAYSIVSQPKTQMVQTANGMVPVQVPPQMPAWLKAPGDAGGPSAAPAGAPAPGLAPPAGTPDAPGTPAAAASPSGATAGAPLAGTKPAPTEMQARNGAIGHILLNEVPTLGKTFSALADPKGQFLNAIPGGLGNAWQSEDYQRAAASVKTSIANVLYSLSGASSNPGEVMKQIEVLTPAFGDKPGAIADKLNRFKTYVRSVSSEANDPELTKSVEDALKQMDAPAAPPAANASPGIAAPKTDEEFNALPSGAIYTDPDDGKQYRKP